MTAPMKTKDLYFAALVMALGLTLERSERESPGGPVWFFFQGEKKVWEEARHTWVNSLPCLMRPTHYASTIRTLKDVVHRTA